MLAFYLRSSGERPRAIKTSEQKSSFNLSSPSLISYKKPKITSNFGVSGYPVCISDFEPESTWYTFYLCHSIAMAGAINFLSVTLYCEWRDFWDERLLVLNSSRLVSVISYSVIFKMSRKKQCTLNRVYLNNEKVMNWAAFRIGNVMVALKF